MSKHGACPKLLLRDVTGIPPQLCVTLVSDVYLQAAGSSMSHHEEQQSCETRSKQAQGSWLVAAKAVSLAGFMYLMLIQMLTRSFELVCSWMREHQVIHACHYTLITVVTAVFVAVVVQLALPTVHNLMHIGDCHTVQITVLAVIAAQLCALASLDWAAAYLTLVCVVPVYKLQVVTGVKALGLLSFPLHYVASVVFIAH